MPPGVLVSFVSHLSNYYEAQNSLFPCTLKKHYLNPISLGRPRLESSFDPKNGWLDLFQVLDMCHHLHGTIHSTHIMYRKNLVVLRDLIKMHALLPSLKQLLSNYRNERSKSPSLDAEANLLDLRTNYVNFWIIHVYMVFEIIFNTFFIYRKV